MAGSPCQLAEKHEMLMWQSLTQALYYSLACGACRAWPGSWWSYTCAGRTPQWCKSRVPIGSQLGTTLRKNEQYLRCPFFVHFSQLHHESSLWPVATCPRFHLIPKPSSTASTVLHESSKILIMWYVQACMQMQLQH